MNTQNEVSRLRLSDQSGASKFSLYPIRHLSPQDQILFEKYGAGPRKLPSYSMIHQAFEAQVLRQPNAIAVQFQNETITYKNLDLQANRLAEWLREQGVQAGDHVGLFTERGIEMPVSIMGILKLGAAYVPQDARIAKREQLNHVIQVAQIKIVLTLSKLRTSIPEGVKILAVDEFMLEESELNLIHLHAAKPQVIANSQSTCFVLFTSGTTGAPNGVQVTHANLCNILLTAPGNLGMGPGLCVSQILNIAFDMAAWEILGSLANGSTLLIRGSDIAETVQKAHIVIATPSVLGKVDVSLCHNLKTVAVAGEPCPRPLADKWSQVCDFYNSCGPTEVTIVNTM